MFQPTKQKRPRLHRRVRNGRTLLVPFESDREEVALIKQQLGHIVEPMLATSVHGWRAGHGVPSAVRHIESLSGSQLSFDITKYFDSIDQKRLKKQLDRMNPTVWGRLAAWMPTTGLAQGCAFTPLLANLYLADVDHRFPMTVRYCDNIMIVDESPERTFLRLSRQLGDIGLTCHEIVLDPLVFCGAPLRASRLSSRV